MASMEAFWNQMFVTALQDAENNIMNFIWVLVRVLGPDEGAMSTT